MKVKQYIAAALTIGLLFANNMQAQGRKRARQRAIRTLTGRRPSTIPAPARGTARTPAPGTREEIAPAPRTREEIAPTPARGTARTPAPRTRKRTAPAPRTRKRTAPAPRTREEIAPKPAPRTREEIAPTPTPAPAPRTISREEAARQRQQQIGREALQSLETFDNIATQLTVAQEAQVASHIAQAAARAAGVISEKLNLDAQPEWIRNATTYIADLSTLMQQLIAAEKAGNYGEARRYAQAALEKTYLEKFSPDGLYAGSPNVENIQNRFIKVIKSLREAINTKEPDPGNKVSFLKDHILPLLALMQTATAERLKTEVEQDIQQFEQKVQQLRQGRIYSPRQPEEPLSEERPTSEASTAPSTREGALDYQKLRSTFFDATAEMMLSNDYGKITDLKSDAGFAYKQLQPMPAFSQERDVRLTAKSDHIRNNYLETLYSILSTINEAKEYKEPNFDDIVAETTEAAQKYGESFKEGKSYANTPNVDKLKEKIQEQANKAAQYLIKQEKTGMEKLSVYQKKIAPIFDLLGLQSAKKGWEQFFSSKATEPSRTSETGPAPRPFLEESSSTEQKLLNPSEVGVPDLGESEVELPIVKTDPAAAKKEEIEEKIARLLSAIGAETSPTTVDQIREVTTEISTAKATYSNSDFSSLEQAAQNLQNSWIKSKKEQWQLAIAQKTTINEVLAFAKIMKEQLSRLDQEWYSAAAADIALLDTNLKEQLKKAFMLVYRPLEHAGSIEDFNKTLGLKDSFTLELLTQELQCEELEDTFEKTKKAGSKFARTLEKERSRIEPLASYWGTAEGPTPAQEVIKNYETGLTSIDQSVEAEDKPAAIRYVKTRFAKEGSALFQHKVREVRKPNSTSHLNELAKDQDHLKTLAQKIKTVAQEIGLVLPAPDSVKVTNAWTKGTKHVWTTYLKPELESITQGISAPEAKETAIKTLQAFVTAQNDAKAWLTRQKSQFPLLFSKSTIATKAQILIDNSKVTGSAHQVIIDALAKKNKIDNELKTFATAIENATQMAEWGILCALHRILLNDTRPNLELEGIKGQVSTKDKALSNIKDRGYVAIDSAIALLKERDEEYQDLIKKKNPSLPDSFFANIKKELKNAVIILKGWDFLFTGRTTQSMTARIDFTNRTATSADKEFILSNIIPFIKQKVSSYKSNILTLRQDNPPEMFNSTLKHLSNITILILQEKTSSMLPNGGLLETLKMVLTKGQGGMFSHKKPWAITIAK